MSRFTVTGSATLEAKIQSQLDAICGDVRRALPEEHLDCLALGGGYGRGEGGAFVQGGVEAPYNDYDLVLVHHASRAVLARLRDVEERHTRATGVHVDIMPLHRARVRRLPRALTWFEFGRGHKVLWGSAESLAPLTRRRLDQIHRSEWGRLLMNRAAGLVFARWVMDEEPCPVLGGEVPDAFVTRQLTKAWLALGDVFLSERGAYHHLVRERRKRFLALSGDRPPWASAYEAAIDFKLSPSAPRARPSLVADLAELSALYAPRLRRRRASPLRPLVGLFATARHLAPRLWLTAAPWAYPRERIRLALAAELTGDRATFERLVDSPQKLVQLWSRYG